MSESIAEDRKRSKYERLHECFWDKRAVQCVIRQMLDERDDLSSIDSVAANRMDYFANLLIGAASDDGKSFGNAAKLREAVVEIRLLLSRVPLSIKPDVACGIIAAKVKHALSAPPEPIGNNAKMREALKYLRDASREFCHLILNSKYNEVFDKYKYPEVAKIRDAIANAGLVLAEAKGETK